jgi:hypothetical protein
MVVSTANATSSSSSIEVSSTYCSNADARSSPWAAECIKSTLTEQETVLGICEKFRIPADYKPSCAGGDGRACKAPPHLEGCICVYEAALDGGMRVPRHPFYSKLLRHYGLAPSQLTPNSWWYMAAFIVLCSDAGLKPRLWVFQHFFRVCAYTHGNRDGSYIIKPHKMSEDGRRGRLFSTRSSDSLH